MSGIANSAQGTSRRPAKFRSQKSSPAAGGVCEPEAAWAEARPEGPRGVDGLDEKNTKRKIICDEEAVDVF